ncbi:hypothetical protein BDZ97DRAFT_1758645 [Flammula alnicola]|nr:hypothetical protein BDZ97DRAFT_1758645 [Flammula alnicola]
MFEDLVRPQNHNTLAAIPMLGDDDREDHDEDFSVSEEQISGEVYTALTRHARQSINIPMKAMSTKRITERGITYTVQATHAGNSGVLCRGSDVPYSIMDILKFGNTSNITGTWFVVRRHRQAHVNDPYSKYPYLRAKMWDPELEEGIEVVPLSAIETHFAKRVVSWEGRETAIIVSLSRKIDHMQRDEADKAVSNSDTASQSKSCSSVKRGAGSIERRGVGALNEGLVAFPVTRAATQGRCASDKQKEWRSAYVRDSEGICEEWCLQWWHQAEAVAASRADAVVVVSRAEAAMVVLPSEAAVVVLSLCGTYAGRTRDHALRDDLAVVVASEQQLSCFCCACHIAIAIAVAVAVAVSEQQQRSCCCCFRLVVVVIPVSEQQQRSCCCRCFHLAVVLVSEK